MSRLWAPLFALTMAAMLSGCAGAGQAGVSNQADHFSYGGQAAGKSGTETYTWQNTQGMAQVQWGGQASSGSFLLVIKDPTGKQVYSKSLSGTGQSGNQDMTSKGTAGDWKVTFTFSDFTGQMGLNIEAHAAAACMPGMPGCPLGI